MYGKGTDEVRAERRSVPVRNVPWRKRRRLRDRFARRVLGFGLSLGNAALMLVQVLCRTQTWFRAVFWQWVRLRRRRPLAVRAAAYRHDTVRSDRVRACRCRRSGRHVAAVVRAGLPVRRRGAGECGAWRRAAEKRAWSCSARREACRGGGMLACLHAAGFALAALFVWVGVPAVSLAGASVGLVAAAFLYGRFLVALARKALMFVVDALFMYVGALSLVLAQVGFRRRAPWFPFPWRCRSW